MKIKRLNIRNIESLEAADIDFDAAPLHDTELFLIYGETGAGKTTILNSICLALYNETPALKAINDNGNDIENIQINNPQQLLRKGSTEGEAVLTFDGNDDKSYKACWSTRRAHGRANGKLQGVKRSLECTTDGTLWHKDKEICAVIQDVVGLSFDEFCRTTLLAQGQFTMFINAAPKDKSAILEKLTGTEIYARVGNEIHLRYSNARSKCQTLAAKIEGARLMTPVERQKKEGNIQALKEQRDAASLEVKYIDTRLAWLEAASSNAASLKKTALRIAELQQQRDSETTKQDVASIKDWDASQEVRTFITNANEEQNALDKLNVSLGGGQQDFRRLLAELQALRQQSEQLRLKLAQQQQEAQEDADNQQMYKERGTVKVLTDAIVQKQQEMNAKNKLALQEETAMQDENKRQDILLLSLQKAKEAEQAQSQKAEALRLQTKDINIQQLSDRLTQCSQQVSSREIATTLLTSYREKKHAVNEQQHKLELLQQQLQQNARKIEEKLEEHTKLTAAAAALRSRYDGMKELSDHLSAIRARFKEERRCPLCGSEIDHLHTDDNISTTLQQALKEYQNADDALQQVKDKGSELRGREKSLKQDIEESKRQQQTLSDALQKTEAATAEAFSSLQIDFHSTEADAALSQQLSLAKERQQQDNNTLQNASSLIKQHNIETTKLATAKETLAKAEKELLDSKDMAYKHATMATSYRQQSQQARMDMEQSITTLRKLITPAPFITHSIPYPANDAWQLVDFAKLVDTVNVLACKSEERSTAIDQLHKSIELATSTTNHLQQRLDALQNDVPELTANNDMSDDDATATSQEVNNLSHSGKAHPDFAERLTELTDAFDKRIRSLVSQIELISNKKKAIDLQIATHFEQHPVPNRQRVSDLMLSLDNNKIKQLRDRQDSLNRQWNEQQGVISNLRQQREELLSRLPADLTDNISSQGCDEALAQELGKLRNLRQEKQCALDALNNELTAQKTLLDDDAQRSEEVSKQRSDLEMSQRQLDDWGVLDTCFGGDRGERFKRLAQSYVLRALLQQANYYMQQLTSRYMLSCEDGSLIINVKDKYQGGVVRPAASLSGGESFIASLALALGLASINKDKINVDTLFIDEGFGTLSADALEVVISTLDRLHQLGGRRVGIISHVAELRDRIRTRIQVSRTSPGTSSVSVVTE